MKNEKRVAFQSQRIAELERQVKSLEAENRSMEVDIGRYKKIILSKDKTIEVLTSEIKECKERFDSEMRDIIELRANMISVITDAKDSRAKYEKEMKHLINRIKKGK